MFTWVQVLNQAAVYFQLAGKRVTVNDSDAAHELDR